MTFAALACMLVTSVVIRNNASSLNEPDSDDQNSISMTSPPLLQTPHSLRPEEFPDISALINHGTHSRPQLHPHPERIIRELQSQIQVMRSQMVSLERTVASQRNVISQQFGQIQVKDQQIRVLQGQVRQQSITGIPISAEPSSAILPIQAPVASIYLNQNIFGILEQSASKIAPAKRLPRSFRPRGNRGGSRGRRWTDSSLLGLNPTVIIKPAGDE